MHLKHARLPLPPPGQRLNYYPIFYLNAIKKYYLYICKNIEKQLCLPLINKELKMDAIIFNFEKLKEEHNLLRNEQKQQILLECQHEIKQNEEQIRSLVIQINQLQANIDLNMQLIAKIDKHPLL